MNQKALIAEFIGTFTLIFIGVGAVPSWFPRRPRPAGGHLNPAVTIGLFAAKKIDAVNAVGYVLAQCLGGIVAAGCKTFGCIGWARSSAAFWPGRAIKDIWNNKIGNRLR